MQEPFISTDSWYTRVACNAECVGMVKGTVREGEEKRRGRVRETKV